MSVVGAALLSTAVTACGSDPDKMTPVRAGIVGGPTQASADYAVLPQTEYSFLVSWTAWCTYDGVLPDTSTTTACDEQPFLARVSCEGAPCATDPADAVGGIMLRGAATIRVRLTAPGDLRLAVELEHATTHETIRKEMAIAVRTPEKLVIDCIYNPAPTAGTNCVPSGMGTACTFDPAKAVPYMPCPATGTFDGETGSPISIWIYGETGELPVLLSPPAEVTFGGFQPELTSYVQADHAQPRAAGAAARFSARIKTAGVYQVNARFGALESQLQTELR